MPPSQYEAKSQEEDDLADLSGRLTEDLRRQIRSLALHRPLTDRWCEMADVFGRLARASDSESKHRDELMQLQERLRSEKEQWQQDRGWCSLPTYNRVGLSRALHSSPS